MLACRNAKRIERLNMTEVERFVVTAVEWDVDVASGGPCINPALNLS
jgi:hypothetical protein